MDKQLAKIVVTHESEAVRKLFKEATTSNVCIDYQTFFKHFLLSDNNFQEQNQNIIDVHLRYRWWVREKMAPYKWLPIMLMTPLIFKKFILFVTVPFFMTKMFDHYFQKFFLWRYRKEKIINVKQEFSTKLSKAKNKHRRVTLYNSIKDNLVPDEAQKKDPEHKYIKFGDFTEYIFHAVIDDKETSNLEQTTLFENYSYAKSMYWRIFAPGTIFRGIMGFVKDFRDFRNDPLRTRFLINPLSLTDRKDIKAIQVYALEDNIDDNVRRWYEMFRYIFKSQLEPSQFKLWEFINFTEYVDIFQPVKYNSKGNGADLILYYGVLGIPKLINMVFKRR